MTLLDNQPTVSSHAYQEKKNTMGRTIVKWMTSTDPKVIGNLYFITDISDIDIDITESPEDCIIICSKNSTSTGKPDILVKKYDSFVSLSFHKIV